MTTLVKVNEVFPVPETSVEHVYSAIRTDGDVETKVVCYREANGLTFQADVLPDGEWRVTAAVGKFGK